MWFCNFLWEAADLTALTTAVATADTQRKTHRRLSHHRKYQHHIAKSTNIPHIPELHTFYTYWCLIDCNSDKTYFFLRLLNRKSVLSLREWVFDSVLVRTTGHAMGQSILKIHTSFSSNWGQWSHNITFKVRTRLGQKYWWTGEWEPKRFECRLGRRVLQRPLTISCRDHRQVSS